MKIKDITFLMYSLRKRHEIKYELLHMYKTIPEHGTIWRKYFPHKVRRLVIMHSYTVKFITLSRLLLQELIKIGGKISPSNSSGLHQSKPAGPTRSILSVKRFNNPYVFGSMQ